LDAIRASEFRDFELVVFSDGSTDGSDRLAREYGAVMIERKDVPEIGESIDRFRVSFGPAGGRNQAAEVARGEILFFVDADVQIQPQTIGRIVRTFETRPEISALFGSYDFAPGNPSFLSQFRNLLHTYVHQTSSANAKTFWGGCGAILRSTFKEVGGFDAVRYRFPAVEDIEFGYRLTDAGHRIHLDKDLQVKHLKKWTFTSMVVADVMHRAIPWLQIIYSKRQMDNDLNLKHQNKISVMISGVIFLVVAAMLVGLPLAIKDISDGYLSYLLGIPTVFWYSIFLCGLVWSFVLVNADFYLFLFKLKGFWFVCRAIPVHILFYFYSLLALVVFLLDYHVPLFRRIRKKLGIVSHVQR
jgi:glycosyltransferase involved in cell wall biosynthesis